MKKTYEPEFWVPANAHGVAATLVYDIGNEYENLMTINFYWSGIARALQGKSDAQGLMIEISDFLSKYPFNIEEEKAIQLYFIYDGDTFIPASDPGWTPAQKYKWRVA